MLRAFQIVSLVLAMASRSHAAVAGEPRNAARDPRVVVAEPGRALTLVFPLEHRRGNALRQTARVLLPGGWRLLSGATSIQVTPSERRAHLVQVAVPSGAAPATYAVILERRAAEHGQLVGRDSVLVGVPSRPGLEIERLSGPALVRAGQAYHAEFTVRNRGNTVLEPEIVVSERNGFPLRSTWTDAPLLPGEMRILDVEASTPQPLGRQLRHVIDVHASVPAMRDVRASGASVVTVVPVAGEPISPFHELALQARLNSTSAGSPGGYRSNGFSGHLIGGGLLRPGGTTRLDLVVRSPGAGPNPFGDTDEYRATISSPRFRLTLGDQTVSLSRLTTEARAGVGANGTAQLGAMTMTGFAVRDRRQLRNTTLNGGMIQFQAGRGALLRAHLLQTSGADSLRVASVRTRLTAGRFATLDAEVARSDRSATAYDVELAGALSRLSYSLLHRAADSGFARFGAGNRANAARADLRLVGRLGLRAALTDNRNGGSFRLLARNEPYAIRTAEGAAYFGGLLTVGYQMTARGMAAAAQAGEVTESRIRLTSGGRLGRVNVRAAFDRGVTEVQGRDETHNFIQAALTTSVSAGKRHSYSAFADYESGARGYSPVARSVIRAGVNANLQPADRLRLVAGFSARQVTGPLTRTQAGADLRVSVVPRVGHELTLQMKTGSGGLAEMHDAAIRLSYGIAFGMPIGRARTGGRLVGRVFDVESGRGVRNAMVLVDGRAVMTDEDGRISISGLAAGPRYVQLDLGADGVDRVPLIDVPVVVTSRSGTTTPLNIPVTRGASITGRVRLLAPRSAATWTGDPTALEEADRIEGAVVTLRRGDEVIRRMTDATGAFSATHIRPGTWSIAIDVRAIPAHHAVSPAERTIALGPGESGEAVFDITPRKRRLVMIDQAEIVADNAVSAAPRRAPQAPAKPERPIVRERVRERTAPDPPAHTSDRAQPSSSDTRLPATGRALLFRGQSFYFVGETDRTLQNIALLTYGDAGMWPKLWVANRQLLTDPDAVRPGTVLVVPPRGPLTIEELHARDALLQSNDPMP